MSSQNTPSHDNAFSTQINSRALRDSIMGYPMCEPSGVTKKLRPAFWSRMKYSPGDDSANFRMRAFKDSIAHPNLLPKDDLRLCPRSPQIPSCCPEHTRGLPGDV